MEIDKLVKELTVPYKLGYPVLEPTGKPGDFDKDMVDCPFVFKYNNKFYMTYIGFEGHGYRSGLASSNDLINWKREGLILDWGKPNEFDCFGAAICSIFHEVNLDGSLVLKKYEGKYWAAYTGYPEEGYEGGPGGIGLAYSQDLLHWEKADFNPILMSSNGAEWEKGGLYKGYLMEHQGLFYLFYNAKNFTVGNWIEQTGFAISEDLRKWFRHNGNPVIKNGNDNAWDCKFASDPFIVQYKNVWIMFYYGYDGKNARNGIAFSLDLKNWQKYPEPILDIGPAGSIDSEHAHKPCVIMHNGIIYHFYCAVRKEDEYRTITLATSKLIK